MNIDYNLLINYLWENITFEIFLKFSLVYFFIIWISLIAWVIKDISNRTENIFLQLLSILTIVFLTPLWIFIYLIIRPGKTLFEKYYEEIEDNLDTVEDIVENKNCREDEAVHCFKCNFPVSHDFKFCPNCNIKLKKECNNCKKIIYTWWKNCPYCWVKNENKELEYQLKKEIKEEKKLDKNIKNVDKIINEQEEFKKTKQ